MNSVKRHISDAYVMDYAGYHASILVRIFYNGGELYKTDGKLKFNIYYNNHFFHYINQTVSQFNDQKF